jgi:hypothetical protein
MDISARQDQDLTLWREWKQTGRADKLEALLTRLQPLIYREVSKWQSSVPGPALEAKARLLTAEALKTYDPNRGASIGTHVTSRLRKLSRSVYPYQNVARLPENKQLLYNTYSVAQNQLVDDLGRDPTSEEMADHLKWSHKKVIEFGKAYGVRELVESAGATMDFQSAQMPSSGGASVMDMFFHGLDAEDKKMFKDITGYDGAKELNNAQLCAKYKLTQGQLSYKRRKLVDGLLEAHKRTF